jgi:hypothetical protein
MKVLTRIIISKSANSPPQMPLRHHLQGRADVVWLATNLR